LQQSPFLILQNSRVNLKKKAGYGKDQNPGKWRYVPFRERRFDLLFNISLIWQRVIHFTRPSDSEVSTQQAADMLNVSRPHLVKMLEQGGDSLIKRQESNRRILLENLLKYDEKLVEE